MRTVLRIAFIVSVWLITDGVKGNKNKRIKPNSENWIPVDKNNRTALLGWLVGEPEVDRLYARSNDVNGFYNNPFRPDLGAVETVLLRRSPAQYSDGTSKPGGSERPNPIVISEALMKKPEGSPATASETGKTALLVFFGQQVVDEIVDTRKPACPPEYFNVPIPEDHSYRNLTGVDTMPFLRTQYNTMSGRGPNSARQQLNSVTPYLDGNLVYGTSSTWTDLLRHFSNGTLAPHGQLAWSDPDGRFPELNAIGLPMANPPPPNLHEQFKKQQRTPSASRLFMFGNPRANETPMLLSLSVLWFRWHNYIARYLAHLHDGDGRWTDDRVFNEAKKWVIATYQHIVSNEWIPHWIGESLPEYAGYNAAVDPQIDQLFQTAAMRYGYTLVPSGIYLRDFDRYGCKPVPTRITGDLKADPKHANEAFRTCNSYWQKAESINSTTPGQPVDVERLLMGMASQLSEREDHFVVDDLRGSVYGPLEFPRRDLMAINIQRGRDHGIPDYNTARQLMQLEPIKSFETFVDQTKTWATHYDPDVIERFALLYENNTIDDVDLWVGGLLETALGPGRLFKAIIRDQFTRIRSGDRFWYANLNNGLFTKEEVERLEQLTLYDVIMAVTSMDVGDLQEKPFLSPSYDIKGQNLTTTCMEQLVEVNCRIPGLAAASRCRALPPVGSARLDFCTPPSSYSYFSGSEASFVITAVLEGLVVVFVVVVLLILLRLTKRKRIVRTRKMWKSQLEQTTSIGRASWYSEFTSTEWMGKKEGVRIVNILFNSKDKSVEVRDERACLVRTMDLSRGQPYHLHVATNETVAVLKLPKEYDLVLKFNDSAQCQRLIELWEDFLKKSGLQLGEVPSHTKMAANNLLLNATTYKKRRKKLQKFFRVVFSQALALKRGESVKEDFQHLELSKEEFAEHLRMAPDSPFVSKMFELADKDNNGCISFYEFLDLLVIFCRGNVEDKLKYIFNIYDPQRDGQMTLDEFSAMIHSLVDLSNAKLDASQIASTVKTMIESMRREKPDVVTLAEFQEMMKQHRDTLSGMQIAFNGPDVPVEIRKHQRGAANLNSRYQQARQTITDIYKSNEPCSPIASSSAAVFFKEEPAATAEQPSTNDSTEATLRPTLLSPTSLKTGFVGILDTLSRNLDYWRLEAFWIALFTIYVWAVFVERAYTYRVEREHAGFRQVTGWGIPITRGAASSMMLCFSAVLLTTCRHVTTWLRETAAHRFIPLDSVIRFHQYAAYWGVFFAVVHTVGHGFNFYNISAQPVADLACLFSEVPFSSDYLPKYHDWVLSVTGITGVALWVQTVVIFFFSLPIVRRRLYAAFWITHNSYPLFYALLLLHGASRLVQEPHFPFYLLGPAVVFAVNFLVSLSRRSIQVSIVDAQLLPSDVTKLMIQRPSDFKFRSGQWIRLSCPSLHDNVYHPFTVSSAPQSSEISVHIRAVGPWTRRMRRAIQHCIQNKKPLPKLFMDGPYGEGHQEWRRYSVVVLIGAGIGVTPFSSILQDMAAQLGPFNTTQPFRCQKVYFLWVTRDQKQFEWMVDILRQVETKDTIGLVSPHIFITQFSTKFDIRTVMLYVCEREFQKVEQRSLFTGLRAVTHFGHPDFMSILKSVASAHHDVDKIGVFSCGPRSLTRSVDSACHKANEKGPISFRHHYEIY